MCVRECLSVWHNINAFYSAAVVGRKVELCLAIMDDRSSLGKVSGSTESVSTVTSEEFVLVQPGAEGSPSSSEGKPRLKVLPDTMLPLSL